MWHNVTHDTLFMKYTLKIQKAIKFAAKTHQVYQNQKRKGKEIPYITHPLTVGLILSLAGASENVIIAGILHDTIEDSPEHKKVTKEFVAERFGEHVADLVNSVTEQDKSLPYHQRKLQALRHIETFSHDSVLLKSADVLSNTSEIIDDYAREGEMVFERFSASKEVTVDHYTKVIKALLGRWEDNPLAEDLQRVALDLGALCDEKDA